MQRSVDYLPLRQRFLIICEGEKTEPNYFSSFRAPRSVIKVKSFRYSTRQLVEKAVELKQIYEEQYDQYWCIFDREEFTAIDFNSAFKIARRHNIKIAYSNEAFELWYLLHFVYLDTGISRQEYIRRLENKEMLGHKYQKNSNSMYSELVERQSIAIRNASNLLANYNPPNPAEDNPSTTVHKLVIELNKYSK